ELGPLQLRIPAMMRRAEGENAFLGTRPLLVAARATEREVEAVRIERLLQAFRLPQVGVHLRAMRERIDAACARFRIDVHDEIEPELACRAIAKLDHLAK